MQTQRGSLQKKTYRSIQTRSANRHWAKGLTKQALPSLPLARAIDHRPETAAQLRRQALANQSPQVQQLKARQAAVESSPWLHQIIQRQLGYTGASPIQRTENRTGLPDSLKSGVESLSGLSMDDVKVHYNSSKPAQLSAHAYAQGTDIHLAPGQEKHLAHEAWHVVQQKQGRVQPTLQMKEQVNINDDAGLEREADLMGARAMMTHIQSPPLATSTVQRQTLGREAPIQMALPPNEYDTKGFYTASKPSKKEPYTIEDGRPSSFSVDFKEDLIQYWNENGEYGLSSSKRGNKLMIRTVTDRSSMLADWVPLGAFQIDHEFPWDGIAQDLMEQSELLTNALIEDESKVDEIKDWQKDTFLIMDNEGKGSIFKDYVTARKLSLLKKAFAEKKVKLVPTMYGARMYYHDVENLRPMQGSENASKGKGAASVGIDDAKPGEEQLKVEEFVVQQLTSMLDSVQNAFKVARKSSNTSLLEALEERWGEGGDAREALIFAAKAASSETTGAPPTPGPKDTPMFTRATPSPMPKGKGASTSSTKVLPPSPMTPVTTTSTSTTTTGGVKPPGSGT